MAEGVSVPVTREEEATGTPGEGVGQPHAPAPPPPGTKERDLLVELTPSVLCLLGADTLIKHANPALARLSGLPAGGLVGTPFTDLAHPDDFDVVVNALWNASSSESETEFECRCAGPDQGDRLYHWQVVPDPSTATMVAVGRDVTDQRALEHALADAEGRVRTLLDHVPVGIFELDREGRCTFVNEQWTTITGRGAFESEVHGWLEVLPAGERADFLADWLRNAADGNEFTREIAVERSSGRPGYAIVQTVPLHGDLGELRGHLGSLVDVTERRRAEEAVRDREARFRQFAATAPVGIVQIGLDATLLEVNPAAASILGYTPDEVVGMNPVDLWHPEERHAAVENMAAILSGERDVNRTERKFLHRDGHPVVMYATATLVRNADGSPSFIVALLEDRSEQHRLEVELRGAQKLEAVGRLAGGIAHEINTPIQFVGDNVHFLGDAFGSMVELLGAYRDALRTDGPQLPWDERRAVLDDAEARADVDYLVDEVPEAVRQALDGVERVATIVRAMKAFGHPDTGHPKATDLNEAITNTITVARNETKYVSDVVAELGDLPLVTCFPGDLNQVFLNLLVNAAHAIGDVVSQNGGRGTITVSTRRDGDAAVIEVADTGGGIPAHIAERVFDPFFTTKEVGRGTGQGLALARAVVEKHTGTISFESEPGNGTTFIIRLPVDGPPSTREEAVEPGTDAFEETAP